MDKFLVAGGKKLFGEIKIGAAKNAYLPILAACILVDGVVVLHNYPNYSDTDKMCEILRRVGAKVKLEEKTLIVDARSVKTSSISEELTSSLRASIFTLGPLLGRLRNAKIAYPGGCAIGARPIDIHLLGLKKMGIEIIENNGYICCDASKIHSCEFMLKFPSVGATENLMMASVLTDGVTKLHNCAMEPEILDLQNFLNSLGAKICGAGTDEIIIHGVKKLSSGSYSPISDRIIAGTYLIATAMCGGKVTIKNINPMHMQALITKLGNSACQIETCCDSIKVVSENRPLTLKEIETSVYPGIPTDLQAQLMALECVSKGTCQITENLFESRFKHVSQLLKMGANIKVDKNTAIIKGRKRLCAAEVYGEDLRGTAALVLAGLEAKGNSIIHNIHFLDRGYECFENDLNKLGAEIKRVKE